MTLPFILFTYTVTFCVTLFLVLPFKPRFWIGLLANIVLALAVTLFIYWLIKSGLVPVRNVIQ